jgi:hypothetical protein
MQTLKPHQLLAIFLATTAGTLLMYLMFNIFQALCFGIVVGIFVYAFLLSLEDKKPKKPTFPTNPISPIDPANPKL